MVCSVRSACETAITTSLISALPAAALRVSASLFFKLSIVLSAASRSTLAKSGPAAWSRAARPLPGVAPVARL